MEMPSKPFLVMIAGPNGSGKTTLTRYARSKGFNFGHYINADDIAQNLVSGSYFEKTKEAQRIADEQRSYYIKEKKNFSFETVMSHVSKLELLKYAAAEGFDITTFFVGIEDPMVNVARVALRVSQGGHDVPEDRIVQRWYRTMSYLAEAIRLSNKAYIFDNSGRMGLRPMFTWTEGTGSISTQNPDTETPAWVQKYVISPLSADILQADQSLFQKG